MRYLKNLILMFAASLFLVACGGGDTTTPAVTPPVVTSAAPLVDAYNKIQTGMTLATIQGLVGYAPTNISPGPGTNNTYTWILTTGSNIESLIVVIDNANGFVNKKTVNSAGGVSDTKNL